MIAWRAHTSRGTTLFATALVGAMLFAGCGASEGSESGLDRVEVLQAGQTSLSLNVMFVAKELGYFEDEGIEVVEQDAGDLSEMAFLDNGQTDLAYTGATEILTGIGAGVDVRVLYEYWHEAAEGVYVLDGSSIQQPADLEGKTVGLASDSDLQFLKILLDSAGLTEEDVKTVVVGDKGGVIAKALNDGKIDAISGSTGEERSLAGAGVALRDLTPVDIKKTPGQSFVAMADTVDDREEVLKRFFRAWARASYASTVDGDVLLAMAKKNIPEATLDEVQAKIGVGQADKAIPVNGVYGEIRPEVWEQVNAALAKAGSIPGEVDLEGRLDDRFIEYADDFDRAEVEADVKAWAEANM